MNLIERLKEADLACARQSRDPVSVLKGAASWELVKAAGSLGETLDSVERVLAHLEEAEGILTYLASPGDAAVAIAMEAEEVPGDLGWILDRLVELQDGAKEVRDILGLAYSIVEARLASITKGGEA